MKWPRVMCIAVMLPVSILIGAAFLITVRGGRGTDWLLTSILWAAATCVLLLVRAFEYLDRQ